LRAPSLRVWARRIIPITTLAISAVWPMRQGYAIRGGNHLAGTHIMGTTKTNSVVDKNQRSWDHENLYLVGGGSMPTIGTANVTLTLAAMCFRSGRDILKSLH